MTGNDLRVRIEHLESRRLFAAGDPLDSFGRHGQAVSPYELYGTSLSHLQAAPGGKLLASIGRQSYQAYLNGKAADFVRFNADGSPDPTFGGIGAGDSFFGTVRRIAVRSDGKFYALGTTRPSEDVVSPKVPWFIARFHADGRLDRSFGERGRVKLDLRKISNELTTSDGFSENRTSFLDTDGRLTMLVSYRYDNPDGRYGPAVVRFDATGQRDPTFVHGMPALLRPTEAVYSDPAITGGHDGSVLVAAVQTFRGKRAGGILKLTPRGDRDTAFGSGGFATASAGYV